MTRDPSTRLAALLRRDAARLLRDVHCTRLERAAAAVPEDDLWWRPHRGVISVGTILLHLEGNVRQWILSGLGGRPDDRDRAGEFAAEGGASRPELVARLRTTVDEAAATIEDLGDDRLVEPVTIQGFETTVVEAVTHVVEHFAWHTGQAVWIAKARAGEGHGVSFYDDAAINAARNDRGDRGPGP